MPSNLELPCAYCRLSGMTSGYGDTHLEACSLRGTKRPVILDTLLARHLPLRDHA